MRKGIGGGLRVDRGVDFNKHEFSRRRSERNNFFDHFLSGITTLVVVNGRAKIDLERIRRFIMKEFVPQFRGEAGDTAGLVGSIGCRRRLRADFVFFAEGKLIENLEERGFELDFGFVFCFFCDRKRAADFTLRIQDESEGFDSRFQS